VVAAALLNLADAATPSVLGRDLNLYWDLGHLPSLVGLARESAGLWSVSVAAALVFGAVSLVVASAYWIWRKVLVALTDRRIAIGVAILLGMTLDVTAFVPAERRPLATGLGVDIVRHAAAFDRAWRISAGGDGPLPEALATPGPPPSDLAGLKRRDVYLVYIESYGTTVFDTPEFRSALRGSLAQFEAAMRGSGYTIASNRLISPTFGGGSASPMRPSRAGLSRRSHPLLALLGSGRKLLPAISRMWGRAVDVMPGSKTPSPKLAPGA
jgi:hypothetical protein